MAKRKILIVSFIGVLIIGIGLLVMIKGGFNSNEGSDSNDVNAFYDAEEYYKENSEIIDQVKAKRSKGVQTETEAVEELSQRGFEQYPITSDCTINGEHQESTEISDSSDEKHPTYRTYYVTGNEEMWTIDSINGHVTAFPVMFNQSNGSKQTIVSERKTVCGYDIATNTFFENEPSETVVDLIVVERIDAETLEELEL